MVPATLPHWHMTALYPGPDSPECALGFNQLAQAIAGLAAFFDACWWAAARLLLSPRRPYGRSRRSSLI